MVRRIHLPCRAFTNPSNALDFMRNPNNRQEQAETEGGQDKPWPNIFPLLRCFGVAHEHLQGARVRRFNNGGRGGIRTPDTVSRTPDFESGALNHSATLPAGSKIIKLFGSSGQMVSTHSGGSGENPTCKMKHLRPIKRTAAVVSRGSFTAGWLS